MIDWNKPIRQKDGTAAKYLYRINNKQTNYPRIVIITYSNGDEFIELYTDEGGHSIDSDHMYYDLENIPEPKPNIDWTKDVQMASLYREDWTDFIAIAVNENHVYGHTVDRPRKSAGIHYFCSARFRNKPVEPKRVRCWVNLYSNSLGQILSTKEDADKYALHDRKACVKIDVPEGYGLDK